MSACKERVIRRWLLILALVQLIASVVALPLIAMASAFATLGALDKWWGLKQEGAFNEGRLAEIQDGRFADWVEVPYYLVEGYDSVVNLAFGVSVVCFITSMILFALWRYSRPKIEG